MHTPNLGLAVLLLAVLSACITAKDMQRISDRQAEAEQRLAAVAADYDRGEATLSDVLEEARAGWASVGQEAQDVARDATERGKEAAGYGLEAVLGTGLGTAALAFFGVKAAGKKKTRSTAELLSERLTARQAAARMMGRGDSS